MDSIIQKEKECFFCKNPKVHRHHVFFGKANRRLSEKYGCVVYLCRAHHTDPMTGVHHVDSMNKMFKILCQSKMENDGMSREEFVNIFGKSWL